MFSSYAQAWDPSFLPEGFPLSYHIVKDIDCVVEEAYIKISQATGVVVPHLGTRCEQRYDLGLNQLPQGDIVDLDLPAISASHINMSVSQDKVLFWFNFCVIKVQ